jgi:hypothetical protein
MAAAIENRVTPVEGGVTHPEDAPYSERQAL